LMELRIKFDVDHLLDDIQKTKNRVMYSTFLINEGIEMIQGPTVTYGGTEGVLDLTSKAIIKMDTAIENYYAKKTTSSTEPLGNIGTYGTAGCMVHALNTLRGRSSYANGELVYAVYVLNEVENELDKLQTLTTNEDLMTTIEGLETTNEELLNRIEELKRDNENLENQLVDSADAIKKQISQIYIYATIIGVISAIVTSAILYIITQRKT
jgi:cell division protein FtsB